MSERGHKKREVDQMYDANAGGPRWSRYLTTQLFVLLLKFQGQYTVRRALVDATNHSRP